MSDRRSTTKKTIQAYTSYAKDFLSEWHGRTYRVPPHLKAWIQHLPPHPFLLDLGCGPGQDGRYLRRQKFHVVGLDMTWPFLRVARKRSPKWPLVQGDIEHLPFFPRTFDGIWAAASLIHVTKKQTRQVFKKLHHITKPGGILGATMMHGNGSGYVANGWIRGRYFSRWHKEELQRMVEQAGWEVLFLKTVHNQERKGRWLNVIVKRKA